MDHASSSSQILTTTPTPWQSALLAWSDNLAKRLLDVAVASVGLIVLFPLFAFIAVRLKLDSPGPIFFSGRRTGRNGKDFWILKFRTMHEVEASYLGAKITAQDDPRVTPLGRWLRESKINELPQLWNVLKGEMSLVGPRPEDPDIVATWTEEARREILSVRPGITSPASVIYRGEEAMLTHDAVMQTYLSAIMPSKLRLDQLYVRHRTIWLDLDILFWTTFAVLPRLQSFAPKEQGLFLGPATRFVNRYMSWFVADIIVTLLSIGVAGVIWRLSAPLDIGFPNAFGVAVGFALLFSLSGGLFGMYSISWRYADLADVWGLALGALAGMVSALIVNAMLSSPTFLPPAMIVFASALAFIGFVIVRYRSRLASGLMVRLLTTTSSARAAKERVLIVGGGVIGQSVAWFLSNPYMVNAFDVVGFVDDDLYKQGVRFQGITVVGKRSDIPHLVARHDVGIIFFAIQRISPEDRRSLLDICASTPARLVMIPELADRLKGLLLNSETMSNPSDTLRSTELLSVEQVQTWLAELDQQAQAGNLESMRAFINSMQDRLRNTDRHSE